MYYKAFREWDNIGEFFLEYCWKNDAAIVKHLEHPNVIRVMKELEPLLLGKPKLMCGYGLG